MKKNQILENQLFFQFNYWGSGKIEKNRGCIFQLLFFQLSIISESWRGMPRILFQLYHGGVNVGPPLSIFVPSNRWNDLKSLTNSLIEFVNDLKSLIEFVNDFPNRWNDSMASIESFHRIVPSNRFKSLTICPNR